MQYEIFDDLATRKAKAQKEDQLILPVDPLQENLNDKDDPFLTRCEREIILEAIRGWKITDLMLQVFISRFGIKYRLGNLYQKFKVGDRLELIKKAATDGLHFKTSNGIKHTIFLQLRIKEHGKDESQELEQYLKDNKE